MVLVLPMLFYGIYNGMSGPTMYNSIMLNLYNMFFAALPIMIYSLFDKEFKGDFLADHPYLYVRGRMGLIFNNTLFWEWVSLAAY